MYRRGRQRPWLLLGGGLLAVAVMVVLVRWMIGGSEPASAGAETPNLQAQGDVDSPRIEATPTTPEVAPVNVPPPQPRLTMGAGRAPAVREEVNEPGESADSASSATTVAADPATPDPKQPTPEARSSAPAASMPAAGGPAPTNQSSAPPASQRVQIGLDLIKQNKPVEARKMLSSALFAGGLSDADAQRVRDELTKVNQRLVFGPEVAANDPFASQHVIEPGESLAKLPRKLGLKVDWRFLQRINRISDPARIRAGQKIKVVTGPFHAIVDKRTFRMDLYMGDIRDPVYVRSFTVGLGTSGTTPEGAFVVKPDSKLVNPAWTNPRTGEHFDANDPKNPLGEFWIGLVGDSDNIRGLETYGIHGTVDPDSVGKEMSMGCVRLLADDIALVYEVLVDSTSRVEVRGNDWP